MKIYITRHGETQWNVEKKVQGKADIELNDNGKKQACDTGMMLKNKGIDLIISSPLIRAVQTSRMISDLIGVEFITNELISERDFGEHEGKKMSDFDFKSFWSYSKNIKYEKAENIRDFFEKVYSFFDKIKEEYKDKNILIVTHGGVSIPANCYFNGIPEDDNLLDLVLHNCEYSEYDIKEENK